MMPRSLAPPTVSYTHLDVYKRQGMSRVHLYKKLLQITGKTPIEFIRVIRLKRAALMLRESQQNVSSPPASASNIAFQ